MIIRRVESATVAGTWEALVFFSLFQSYSIRIQLKCIILSPETGFERIFEKFRWFTTKILKNTFNRFIVVAFLKSEWCTFYNTFNFGLTLNLSGDSDAWWIKCLPVCPLLGAVAKTMVDTLFIASFGFFVTASDKLW